MEQASSARDRNHVDVLLGMKPSQSELPDSNTLTNSNSLKKNNLQRSDDMRVSVAKVFVFVLHLDRINQSKVPVEMILGKFGGSQPIIL